jgi:DNA-binding XRE family transcriptional regulator
MQNDERGVRMNGKATGNSVYPQKGGECMTINTLINSMSWFKKLEMLRAAKGWSQEEAAENCGTTKKNYWLWENGMTTPRFNSKQAIARAFGVEIKEIWGDQNDITKSA